MRGFCPKCGGGVEVIKIQDGKVNWLRVTRCNGCGARTSWYSDGSVRIWSHGGGMFDIPEGKMIVSPGKEE